MFADMIGQLNGGKGQIAERTRHRQRILSFGRRRTRFFDHSGRESLSLGILPDVLEHDFVPQSEVNENLILALGLVDAPRTLERVPVAELALHLFSEVVEEQMFQQLAFEFEFGFFAKLTSEHGDFAVSRPIALRSNKR